MLPYNIQNCLHAIVNTNSKVYNPPELTKQTGSTCWPCSLPLRQLHDRKWRLEKPQAVRYVIKILKKMHIGPLLKSGKEAAIRWPTTHFRQLSAVQVGLVLSSCKQLNTAMPKPGWSWCVGGFNGNHVGPGWGSDMQWSHLPWWTAMGLNTLLSLGPHSLLAAQSESGHWASTYMLLFLSHVGPQLKVQHAMK